MHVDVLVETTIARTPEVVSMFAGDPTNATEWYANIRSVTWKTPPPTQVGSRMEFEAQFLGRRLVYTYEIAGKLERWTESETGGVVLDDQDGDRNDVREERPGRERDDAHHAA